VSKDAPDEKLTVAFEVFATNTVHNIYRYYLRLIWRKCRQNCYRRAYEQLRRRSKTL